MCIGTGLLCSNYTLLLTRCGQSIRCTAYYQILNPQENLCSVGEIFTYLTVTIFYTFVLNSMPHYHHQWQKQDVRSHR